MDELTKRGVLFNPKALAHFRSYLFECASVTPRVPFERTVSHLGFTVDALGESWSCLCCPARHLACAGRWRSAAVE